LKIFNEIVEAETVDEVLKHLQGVPADAVVFLDIDDTVITPVSTTFRAPPYNGMVDEIKSNKDKYSNYVEIVSNWRLQRKVMLVDPQWPAVIEGLKKHRPIYALTKMDSGVFGNIESMEEWRFKEVASLGVKFSDNPNIPYKKQGPAGPTFYKGILLTGSASKGQALQAYHEDIAMKFMVMVDDRMDYLADIMGYCQANGVGFLGVFFKGVALLPGAPDPDVAEYQRQHLLQHAQWLEDDEAARLLRLKQIDN